MELRHSTKRPSETAARWSPVFIRLALGITMVVAGVGKVFATGPKAMGIEGFAGFLASLGVPLPTIMAWGVGLLELVGGILLLVGLAVRITSALIAIDMFVATVLYHLPNGYPAGSDGIELTLVLSLIAVALVLSGPGALSIEQALSDQEDRTRDSSQSRATDR
ncbi:DoxX family protein [Haloterrigena salifodinae]|uniref:DoxX family protein n=2 Tax=Haloterrigena salifodinae TaxID=2675099 RepID=A0A8T8DXJ4_9EURY|nr:DoxX family protein [Haloterrigena salifodinae]QRV14249.1 DoxX family protein [Haloterrigena salifodinae]